jgi:ubiquinone/menaquinone biosynthesis C-methylase UbiE
VAGEYGFSDEWYAHYYAVTRRTLLSLFSTEAVEGRRVLDLGCGHGYFSSLLGRLGGDVVGLDLSVSMLKQARFRLASDGLNPALVVGDGEALPFASGRFDIVLCCGDVLDYVGSSRRVLTEIRRVMKPSGLVLVVAGNRATLGFHWSLLSKWLPPAMSYGMTPANALQYLFSSSSDGGDRVPFPHVQFDGSVVQVPLHTTTYSEMKGLMASVGMRMRLAFGIHILTELVPYTLASNAQAPLGLRRLTKALSSMDRRLASLPPMNRLGGHLLVVGEKVPLDA